MRVFAYYILPAKSTWTGDLIVHSLLQTESVDVESIDVESIDVDSCSIEQAKEVVARHYDPDSNAGELEWRLYAEEDGPNQNGVLQLWHNDKYTGYDIQYNSQ